MPWSRRCSARRGAERRGHRAVPSDPRLRLRADCGELLRRCAASSRRSRCRPTSRSTSRPACRAPTSRPDFRCGIHANLRERGFPGCTAYDCFGAGQQVAQVTFGGRDWREQPVTAEQMFAVFPIMRQLHELLWYLAEALAVRAATSLHGSARRRVRRDRAPDQRPDAQLLRALDVARTRSASTRCCTTRAGSSGPRSSPAGGSSGRRPHRAGPAVAPTCAAPTCAGRT